MERKVEIDRMKGVAILLVVMGHIYCKSMYITDAESHPVFHLISLFHMPFFMFLSGVVISKIPSFSKCLVKCLYFILPALFIGAFIAVITHRNLGEMFYANMKFGYWYLYVLAFYYLILQSFRWISKTLPNFLGGAIYIIQAVTIYLVLLKTEMLLPEKTVNLFSLRQSLAYFPYFMAGTFIARYDLIDKAEEKRLLPSAYTSSFMLIIIAILFTSIKDYSVLSNLHGLTAIAIIAMLCSLMVSCKDNNTIIDRMLEYLGKNTLDIYIYHYIIILLLNLELFAKWFSNTGNYLIEVLFCFALSIGIAYLSLLIGILIRKSHLFSNIVYGQFVTYNNGRALWRW